MLLRLLALTTLGAALLLVSGPFLSAQDAPRNNNPGEAATPGNQPAAPTSADLRYRFADGQSRQLLLTENVTERTTDRDRTIQQIRQTRFNITERVTELQPNGSARIQLTYDRVRYTQTSDLNPNSQIVFDSNNDEATTDTALTAYQALAGKSFQFVLSPVGAVTDVRGYSALLDEIFDDLDGTAFADLRAQLEQSFSNEAMARELSSLYAIVPTDGNGQPRRASLEDAWDNGDVEQTIAFVGAITSTPRYVLRSIDVDATGATHATVGVSAVQRMSEDGEPAEGYLVAPGVRAHGELLDGTLNGSYRFDLANGRLTSVSLEQAMALDWVIQDEDAEEGDEPLMRMTARSTGTITLVEVPANAGPAREDADAAE